MSDAKSIIQKVVEEQIDNVMDDYAGEDATGGEIVLMTENQLRNVLLRTVFAVEEAVHEQILSKKGDE